MDEFDGDADISNKGDEDMQAVEAVQEEASGWNTCLENIALYRDRNSYRKIFDHFAPLIKSFALRSYASGSGDTFAEDVVQETMLKVWTKAQSFDAARASASTWIFTIARNARIDLLRKLSRHDNNSAGDSLLETLESNDIWSDEIDNDVFNHLAQERSRKIIVDSLKDLPREQSEVLERVFLSDHTHIEVAEELGLPLGTVKSRVRLALKKLKVSIDR
ncbi:MAG: sigma-70 family RNA polymerase sigma factor [Pseudohongiellaceae bacterium]